MKLWDLTIRETVFFKIAFAFSVVMLIVIAGISFKQLHAVNNAQNSVISSRERQIELEKLFSVIKDAERMQRGYIITGDVTYLNGFNKSRKQVAEGLNSLNKLVNNTTLTSRDIDSLKILINNRLNYMDQVLKFRNNSPALTPSPSPLVKNALKKGAAQMQKIDVFINNIIDIENNALHKYEAYHQAKNRFLPYTTAFIVVFSLIIFFISFYKINKDALRNKKMNDDLMIVNNSFHYAEEISQMGHWKRNLKTFEIKASDNMFRLLGLEPGSVTFDESTLMQFVHPDDKTILTEAFEKVKSSYIPPDITYRIIRPDGEIRYLKSTGKLVTGNNPMILGATCDITKQMAVHHSLEHKNAELEAVVEELASFNHIASHDLQEPLRKIQMFISRITAEEADALSETGREYFNRVSASAVRMEKLIDDLLLYSETNKEDQVFEITDLNDVLTEAKQNLSTEIEDKSAVIISEELPKVLAISFQMRQLFINIIGNALKYSKQEVLPQIKITCSVVKSKDLIDFKPDSKEYYKITITDNGIGFKQEFAEKIFVLFQRLHKKENYSGTGIGLAICKKIVENHKGYISAESTPDISSSFHVYMPKATT